MKESLQGQAKRKGYLGSVLTENLGSREVRRGTSEGVGVRGNLSRIHHTLSRRRWRKQLGDIGKDKQFSTNPAFVALKEYGRVATWGSTFSTSRACMAGRFVYKPCMHEAVERDCLCTTGRI